VAEASVHFNEAAVDIREAALDTDVDAADFVNKSRLEATEFVHNSFTLSSS
jgi:hypothetical protein